ncbi:hypothetical protein PCIT_a1295 [Pseudoalteromonas citrea]|uniref:FAS1 domain-containing protein n=2 Tax=Pseudoalteromonas citrea TaxID=43655 RepID=A0AAD4FTS7_9GAMM|nr:fasciclin domain-containing protein [Pseudoalteromonas citrea]KAF7775169.1 hypothetical protein PCIT_a1295 [Pseudoalteromonas citrea]
MKALTHTLSLAFSALLLVGCNSDDNHNTTSQPTPLTPTTIVDVAKGAGSFTTLVATLEATGLDKTLADNSQKYTVFAPTDAAFEALGQDTIDALLADTDKLSSILTYHVLSGEVNAETALTLAGSLAPTVNGDNIALSLDADTLLVNKSSVITTDIQASNGIIHVIDAVLQPISSAENITNNIVQTAENAGVFNTLLTALKTTGLDTVLSDSENKYTVFAPTDAAFAALGQKTINTLLANPDTLKKILQQHVLSGQVDSVTAMSLNGKSATTVLGNQLAIKINATTDMLSFGGVPVSTTDVMTTNGVIHIIDAVVTADVTLPESFGTLADVASEAGSFNTLLSVLAATGLDTLVADPTKTFTVFAPTDAAFAALGQETLTALLNDTEQLKNILLYHLIADNTVLQDAAVAVASSNDQMVNMANESKATLSYVDMVLFINASAVTAANVTADNGVIHVINSVLTPPAMMTTPTKTIAQTAIDTPELSTLVSALQAANLVDTFNDTSKSYTVFAPTNTAFKKLPKDTLTALLADSTALTGILTQHAVDAAVNSQAAYASNGKQVTTLANKALSISIYNLGSTSNTESDSVAYSSAQQGLVTGNGSQNKNMTVYVFDNDLEQSSSTCNDGCQETWPPVIGTAQSIKNIQGLSLITRSDETQQVAYLGRPLYRYINDAKTGDKTGNGLNNVWWTVNLPTTSLQVSGSNVIGKDIYTTNGIVHLIDTVITEAK